MLPPPTTILLLKSPSLPFDSYTSSFPPPLYSTPIHIPPLITTLHPTPLIALLSSSLLDYSAWIFTSQRAVRSLILAFEQQQQQQQQQEAGVSDDWKREIRENCRIPLFAVGPGTAELLEREVIGGEGAGWMGGCWVEGGEDAGKGENLVPIIVSQFKVEEEDVLQENNLKKMTEKKKKKKKEVVVAAKENKVRRKKKVLWLTGEKRREALRTGLEVAGIDVDCCVAYSTSLSPNFLPSFSDVLRKQEQQHPRLGGLQQFPSERRRRGKESTGNGDEEEEEEEEEEEAEEEIKEGARWVVVFSTQGSREILMGLGWLNKETGRVKRGFDEQGRRRTFVASIGGTTAGYLEEEFGYSVDVIAERPSPEGVREGIEGFMRRRSLLL